MFNDNQRSDRRRHPRFSPKDCTFVADLKIGMVVDVSRGGMAFYYADRKPWPKSVPQTGTLQHKKNGHFICNLPMETISDTRLPGTLTVGAMAIHRRSIRFGRLTTAQKEQLDKLIAMAATD